MYEVSGFATRGDKFSIKTDTIMEAIAEVIRIKNNLKQYNSYRLVELNASDSKEANPSTICEWSR